jgi:hypothetical protein
VKSATASLIGLGIFAAALVIALTLGSNVGVSPDETEDQPLASLHDGVGGFPDDCAGCHGDRPDYALAGAQTQYVESGHFLGFDLETPHAYYANGGGCQSCHTHEGFLEFLDTGEREASPYIEWPSQPGCFTCHAPHETGDFELRTTAPVSLVNDRVFDEGPANLCANCHQSRTDAMAAVEPTPGNKVRSYFGPHYGVQSNLYLGTGAYEFSDKTYSSSQHRFEVDEACIGCHMALPEDRYRLTAALGGHSFNIGIGEDEHSQLNPTSCANCHEGIGQVPGTRLFDTPANDDWDNDGNLEVAQAEFQGLLDRLVNENGSGVLQQGESPVFLADGGFNGRVPEGVMRSEAEMAALFNYKFMSSDRSLGVHNMVYGVQVLQDTISALDPTFDTSTRPR